MTGMVAGSSSARPEVENAWAVRSSLVARPSGLGGCEPPRLRACSRVPRRRRHTGENQEAA